MIGDGLAGVDDKLLRRLRATDAYGTGEVYIPEE